MVIAVEQGKESIFSNLITSKISLIFCKNTKKTAFEQKNIRIGLAKRRFEKIKARNKKLKQRNNFLKRRFIFCFFSKK
ncbi:MAG: hypothetical protein HUK18_03190 [Bacteroidales bacterium]|nr:hypothetical protein [Bacteroidales bacterium]